MASKHQRILAEEVDAARFTNSWDDLSVIEKRLKNKATLSSHLKSLASAEKELEASLCNGETPRKKSVDKLRDVYISTTKFRDIQMQAAILLATCEWRLGDVDRTAVLLREACSPTQFTEGSPSPLLQYCKLQAQGYACLGLCYEGEGDKRAAVRAYLELMRWLTHLSGQIEQQTRGLSAVDGRGLFLPEIHLAITRGSLLLLAMQGAREAIDFCRSGVLLHDCVLFATLRGVASVCLSNVLVFHTPGNQYLPPTAEPRPPTFQRVPVPSCTEEEAILVLLVLLNHPLPPSTTYTELQHRHHSQAALLDTLLLEYGQCRLQRAAVCLTESSLPFTAVSESLWMEHLLALLALCKDFDTVYMVAKETVKEVKEAPEVLLYSSKTALTLAHQPLQALHWAQECISAHRESPLLAAAHSTAAAASLALHRQQPNAEEGYLTLAADNIRKAVELDPRSVDHLLQQALIQAEDRQLKDCRNLCRKALKLDPTHWGLTHLLAVMLTGEKKLKEALQLVNFALVHWPRLFGLTMSRIQLVSLLDSSQEALRVCREALHAHQQPEGDLPKIVIGSSSEDESLASSERLSPQVGFSSECCAWLWCKTAEIFLMCGQLKDAANSLKEAQQIIPDSIQVLLLRGRLFEANGEKEEARSKYKLALAMKPRHTPAHVAMGHLMLKEGGFSEAERHFKQGLEYQPKNHQLWGLLGNVFLGQGDHSKAAECFSTALSLEQAAPSLPLDHLHCDLS